VLKHGFGESRYGFQWHGGKAPEEIGASGKVAPRDFTIQIEWYSV
jgi:hypothetical protein